MPQYKRQSELIDLFNKQMKQLSKFQISLIHSTISSEDYNEITEHLADLQEYMINCKSYNQNKQP